VLLVLGVSIVSVTKVVIICFYMLLYAIICVVIFYAIIFVGVCFLDFAFERKIKTGLIETGCISLG